MKREELIKALKEIKKECEKSKHCDQCKLYDVQELDMDSCSLKTNCGTVPCEWNIKEE